MPGHLVDEPQVVVGGHRRQPPVGRQVGAGPTLQPPAAARPGPAPSALAPPSTTRVTVPSPRTMVAPGTTMSVRRSSSTTMWRLSLAPSPAASVTSSPSARKAPPSGNAPVRTLGPGRSASTPTVRPRSRGDGAHQLDGGAGARPRCRGPGRGARRPCPRRAGRADDLGRARRRAEGGDDLRAAHVQGGSLDGGGGQTGARVRWSSPSMPTSARRCVARGHEQVMLAQVGRSSPGRGRGRSRRAAAGMAPDATRPGARATSGAPRSRAGPCRRGCRRAARAPARPGCSS